MRRAALAIIAAMALTNAVNAGDVKPDWSIARQWNEELLQAIRLTPARAPVHARNLYHLSATMYDAWATYDPVARGIYVLEKNDAKDPASARHETISYAAYRLLKARFVLGSPNIPQIQANFDALFAQLGYDASFTSTIGDSPAAIGNRIGAAVFAACIGDGSNEMFNYGATPPYIAPNPPMAFVLPGVVVDGENLNFPGQWQPLAFDVLLLQSGLPVTAAIGQFQCPHWKDVTSFALTAYDRNPENGAYLDQGPPPAYGGDELRAATLEIIALSASLDSSNPATIDISPGVHHNSPLGTYEHPGYGTNPVTGAPYESNVVLVGDYRRAAATHWLDGPLSETPAGHWFLVANQVADTDEFDFRFEGKGPRLDRLQWDVKMYVALGGAVHDAAIAAWSMKRAYESARPISLVRLMGMNGQSSDPRGASFDPNGLPLARDLVRLVEPPDVAPGAALEDLTQFVYDPLDPTYPVAIDDHVGDVIVRSWLGGLYAGTLIITPWAAPPLATHVFRDAAGWHIGADELGVDDTAGSLNPGAELPHSVQLSEIRLAHAGADTDEYVEIAGPPGARLDDLFLIALGSELECAMSDFQGKVQVVVDLSGHALDESGILLIGRSTLALNPPDIVASIDLKQQANCTYALVTGFSGVLGQDADYLDDGILDLQPWTSVVDSVALRRNDLDPAGLYFGAPIVPQDSAANQRHGVNWVLADRWQPFHPLNYVSPPMPAYVSGHSTIGRASAEALARVTGSPFFPDGLASTTIAPGDLMIERGPSAPVTLQWASYYDAADEAGESCLWAGIDFAFDDLAGRFTGASCGGRAANRAAALFAGLAHSPDINGDDIVNAADLALMLGAWGENEGPADLNGDGAVNSVDLGVLLGAWSGR